MFDIKLTELEKEIENFVESTNLLDLCYSSVLKNDDKLKTYLSELSLLAPDFPFHIYNYYTYEEIFSLTLFSKEPSFFQKKGILEEIYNKVTSFASKKSFIAGLPFFTTFLNNLTYQMTEKSFVEKMYNDDLEAYVSLWDLIDNQEYLSLYNKHNELFSLEFSSKINRIINSFTSSKLKDLEIEDKTKKDLLNTIEKSLNGYIKENSLNFYYNSYPVFKSFNQCYEDADLRDKKIEKYLKRKEFIRNPVYNNNIKYFDALNFTIREFLLANEDNNTSLMKTLVDKSIIKRLEEMKVFFPDNQILIDKFKKFSFNERNKEGLREYLEQSQKFLNDESIANDIYNYNISFENKRKSVCLDLFNKPYNID